MFVTRLSVHVAVVLLVLAAELAFARVPLIWHAPFLSGNGYGQEAIEYMIGLAPLIRKRAELADATHDDLVARMSVDRQPRSRNLRKQKPAQYGERKTATARRPNINIVSSLIGVHHGDQPNHDAMAGLSANVSKLLEQVMLGPEAYSPIGGAVVCHSEPGAWWLPRPLYQTARCPPAHASVAIGRTMFETDRIPSGWAERLNQMAEVWVPSEFNRQTFIAGGVDEERIVVVPEAIDSDYWSRERIAAETAAKMRRQGDVLLRTPLGADPQHQQQQQPPSDPLPNLFDMYKGFAWLNKKCDIKFLSVFKWEDRKGWDVLLSAFYEEFVRDAGPRDARTCLIVKASGYHNDIDDGDDDEYEDMISRFVRRKYKRAPQRMHIFSAHIPGATFPLLYSSVDCLVQPSRGEGWGRPHVEAMSMQTPVIATNWSGNTAYMVHGENALLIRVERFSEITKGAFTGHMWAEPSQQHLQQLMRRVANAVAIERGVETVVKHIPESERAVIIADDVPMLQRLRSNARRDMVEKYSPAVIAKQILRRVDNLLRVKLYTPRIDEESHGPPPEEDEAAYEL